MTTLSTAMRRKNGMYYTTVKNIHRVADPLFLWELEKELDGIAALGNIKKRNEAFVAFQLKLGRLRFLDPACGSGNFLTETYISLRRLENRAVVRRIRRMTRRFSRRMASVPRRPRTKSFPGSSRCTSS